MKTIISGFLRAMEKIMETTIPGGFWVSQVRLKNAKVWATSKAVVGFCTPTFFKSL